MSDRPPAAGWYPDERGEMRYWDGRAWTGHTASNYRAAQQHEQPIERTNPTTASSGIGEIVTKPWHKRWQLWAIIVCVAVLAIVAVDSAAAPEDKAEVGSRPAQSDDPVAATPTPTPVAEQTKERDTLLLITDQKDGDSWIASDGNEYRLGLVNTPEANEKCGKDAAAFTRQFVASGFTADVYATDTYGRRVAEVFDSQDRSLNIALARSGLADDRYLAQFRHENPTLASALDRAFDGAPVPACRAAAAAVPLAQKPTKTTKPNNDCMAGYSPCLPIVDDMDCPDIGRPVTVTGSDPYRLDRDKDGVGCD